ncbi:hypothetical protein HY68_15855 [Streptomyces sp. AcH 505]|nr:hypothetical protein HY68_15855 [Streptomyces sp. AcH 505]
MLIQTGDPDARQRLLGAVLYAVTARGAGACPVERAEAGPSAGPSVGPSAGPAVGPGAMSGATAVLTGEAALALYGVRGVATDRAEVLVASRRSLRDTSYVRLRRTTRWPPTLLVNGIPCVRPVRAASDFARHEPSADRVRAVLANTVQKASCHPEDLRAELRASHALRNPALRAVIHELRVGVRSIAEGETRDVLTAARVPPALWNPLSSPPRARSLRDPTRTGRTPGWRWRSTRRSTTWASPRTARRSAAGCSWNPTAWTW